MPILTNAPEPEQPETPEPESPEVDVPKPEPGDGSDLRVPSADGDLITALEALEQAGIQARAALQRWRTEHGY